MNHHVNTQLRRLWPAFPLLAALAFSFVSHLHATNPTDISVGVIRWDGFVGAGNYIGIQENANLSTTGHHWRIPFYGSEFSSTSAEAAQVTATSMADDIAYAILAGIDYWAFVVYNPGAGAFGGGPDLSKGLNLYLADANPNKPKFCAIIGNLPSLANYTPTLVSYMQNAKYQEVNISGTIRPLLYFRSTSVTATDVTNLRNACLAAGVGDPYMVDMFGPSSASTLGLNAVSQYATYGSNGGTYQQMADAERENWDTYKNTGWAVVPYVTLGWDPRVRNDTPDVDPSHYQNFNYDPNSYSQKGAPAESANEIQQAINWANRNSSYVPSKTVIVYAWNEMTEGANQLSPTLYDGEQMVWAVMDVTLNTTSPNLALAPGSAYFASSNWDASMVASKAFDGTTGTYWQGSSSVPFNQQWLKCYFPSLTTFNQIIVSEYGDYRTTGFDIQYWDGTAWQTVYAGKPINKPSAPSAPSAFLFPSVTANQVRLKFTSGSYTPIIYEMEIHNTTGSTDLATGKSYSASSQWQASQAPYYLFDGGLWQAGSSSYPQNVAINFGVPTTFNQVVLKEWTGRVKSFAIETSNDGGNWAAVYTSAAHPNGTIGTSDLTINFTRTTAKYCRLKINSGDYTPIINRFSVYNQ